MGKRVAILRSKSVGGVEPRLDREARTLAAAGYEVHAVLWDRDLAHPAEERRGDYTVHRVRYRAPYNRPALAWKLPRWWRKAYAVLRGLRPNIVHAADFDTAPPALRAQRAWGARFVFDIWDFYADMMTGHVPDAVRRRVATRETEAVRAADLVILPDLARRGRLSAEPRRIVEVMNVPEEREVVPEIRDRFSLFYGGNLAKDRGLLDLVRACEATGAILIVAGQGPDEAELLPLIESSPNATYVGVVPHDEVLRQTASADAVPALYDPAIPNNRLASPNKVFEAMMLGKPVIVSDGTSLADLVRTEGFGIVVPYGDTASLRESIERLMLSPDLCRDLGGKGRAVYAARYRWEIMQKRLLDAYAEL